MLLHLLAHSLLFQREQVPNRRQYYIFFLECSKESQSCTSVIIVSPDEIGDSLVSAWLCRVRRDFCVHSRGHSFDPIPIIFGRLNTNGKIWKLKDFGCVPANLQIYIFQLAISCVHSRGHSFDLIPVIFGRLITHGKILAAFRSIWN